MGVGLIGKVSDLFGLVEEVEVEDQVPATRSRRDLSVHRQAQLHFSVYEPTKFDDVQLYADCIRNKTAIMLNFTCQDLDLKQRILDFMDGVVFVSGGERQAVSGEAILYTPDNVSVTKELCSHMIPSYMKNQTD